MIAMLYFRVLLHAVDAVDKRIGLQQNIDSLMLVFYSYLPNSNWTLYTMKTFTIIGIEDKGSL